MTLAGGQDAGRNVEPPGVAPAVQLKIVPLQAPPVHGVPAAAAPHSPVAGSQEVDSHSEPPQKVYPPPQTPAVQVSPVRQLFPSKQPVPSGAAGLVHPPVDGSHDPATWQLSLAWQVIGAAPVQAPATHWSTRVQGLPSSHDAPSAAAGLVQAPVEGLQIPAVWQVSDAAQVTGLAPVHMPEAHRSTWVQALLSSQVVPSAAGGLVHAPVEGLHVPATWQASDAVQPTGLAPTHAPATHWSTWVQAFPSLHEVPSATGMLEQTPVVGSHAPATWH